MWCHLRYLVLILLILTGCYEISPIQTKEMIVVEGWIESGKHPVVMLSTNVPVLGEGQSIDSLAKYLIRWAKVTISDGEEDVVLTGRMNKDYFPPYIYSTYKMKGKPGKTYEIVVEYSGRIVTASTTIPAPVELEYIHVERESDSDSLFILKAGLKDDPATKDYYKFFTKVRGVDSYYKVPILSTIDDAVLSADISEVNLIKGLGLPETDGSMFFCKGDTVDVKVCTMDQYSYFYWTDFEEITSLSTNPFFPSTKKIRTNINGGLGYWAGYGSTDYTIVIEPDNQEIIPLDRLNSTAERKE